MGKRNHSNVSGSSTVGIVASKDMEQRPEVCATVMDLS
jgi:hypothetical protein